MDIFDEVSRFAEDNHYVDVEDKIPVFLCSIGTHIFNGINKCGLCPFIPSDEDEGEFSIPECILRHNNYPIYTPMSHVADTRLHILMRGAKGSGKSILLQMFLAQSTGLLYHANAADLGLGFRTDIGPNSITEAGMFGSVNDEGEIMGRPLAREMCGGFLGFEEMSSLMDASKKDHSVDMKNQLLTSTDNGRVKKAMRAGWVEYLTRYTIWGGTQPGRMDLESGLDRRFFIIDIEMSPEKEQAYKEAQNKQASVTMEHRVDMAERIQDMQAWFVKRACEAIADPPTGIIFSDSVNEWLMRDEVRGHEADLFRRLCIGYAMMRPKWEGGKEIVVELDDRLRNLLEMCLKMRRNVMDSDVNLIKTAFWNSELSRSALLDKVATMITNRDYQAAKRWVEDNLLGKPWYSEYKAESKGRGRRGIKVYIGYRTNAKTVEWGKANE
tara:strand:- start:101 stop:1420 length:1320 start_codon:yes stop_codon:yes gene_type:complete